MATNDGWKLGQRRNINPVAPVADWLAGQIKREGISRDPLVAAREADAYRYALPGGPAAQDAEISRVAPSYAEQASALPPASAEPLPQAEEAPPPQQPMGLADMIRERNRALGVQEALRIQQGTAGYMQRGGDQLTQYQVQVAPKSSEETRAALRENQEARATQADVEAGSALTLLDEQRRQKAEDARRAVADLEAEREREASVTAEVARRVKRSEELRQQAADVIVQSPSEFWQSRGTGAQVLALMAVGLSSLGAGLQGRGSDMAQRIADMADKEIASQERVRKSLGDQASAVETSVDRYASMYGTPEARRAATKAAVLQAALKQYDALAAQAGRGVDESAIIANKQAIQQKIAEEQATIERAEADAVVQQHVVTQDRYVGGRGGRALTPEEEQRLLPGSKGAPTGPVSEGQQRATSTRVIVDGKQYFAKDSQQAGVDQTYYLNEGKLQRIGASLLQLIDEAQTLTGEDAKRAAVQAKSILLTLKNTEELGVLTGDDINLVREMSGLSVNDLMARDRSTAAGIRQMLQNASAMKRERMRSLSEVPGDWQPISGGVIAGTKPVD
jgi:hypothetical protein